MHALPVLACLFVAIPHEPQSCVSSCLVCACRIEAWVFLNRSIEASYDSNVVSFGRFSLQLRAPSGAPALLVRPNASVLQDRYVITDKIRGYCGNLGIGNAKMATVAEAAAYCSRTPGGLQLDSASLST